MYRLQNVIPSNLAETEKGKIQVTAKSYYWDLEVEYNNAYISRPVLQACKGHDTVVSLSAGDDKRPAKA